MSGSALATTHAYGNTLCRGPAFVLTPDNFAQRPRRGAAAALYALIHVDPVFSQVARMEGQRRQRQAALEAQRAARERAELAQCTFAPAVLSAAPALQVWQAPLSRCEGPCVPSRGFLHCLGIASTAAPRPNSQVRKPLKSHLQASDLLHLCTEPEQKPYTLQHIAVFVLRRRRCWCAAWTGTWACARPRRGCRRSAPRARSAFSCCTPRGPPAPHTVPQPFALATEVGRTPSVPPRRCLLQPSPAGHLLAQLNDLPYGPAWQPWPYL